MSKKKSKLSFFVFIFTFVLILMCVCVCICINVFGVGAGGNSIRACRINPGLVDPTNPHPSPDTRSVQHWYKYFLYLCTHKYEYKSQVKQKSTPTKITHPVQCGLVCMCGCVAELWRIVWCGNALQLTSKPTWQTPIPLLTCNPLHCGSSQVCNTFFVHRGSIFYVLYVHKYAMYSIYAPWLAGVFWQKLTTKTHHQSTMPPNTHRLTPLKTKTVTKFERTNRAT